MFGSSESEEEASKYDDTRIDALVEQAEGDSVTADRLVGDEQYYPDAMRFLTEDERPQHLVLLTTSMPTMQQFSNYSDSIGGLTDGGDAMTATGEGVLIIGEREVRAVVDEQTWVFPYEALDRVQYEDDEIYLLVGSVDHNFNIANAADEDETRAGFKALESRFLEAHR